MAIAVSPDGQWVAAGGNDAAIVRQRFLELGYKEGASFLFDLRSAHGDLAMLPKVAADLVAANPDVIIAGFGTATAKAAQAATATIPIVFSNVGDPIGSGIVQSLSRPGANLTGLAAQAAEISGKRLELLNQFVPGIHAVAALEQPDAPFSRVALPLLQKAARDSGQQLVVCDFLGGSQVEEKLAGAAAGSFTVIRKPSRLLIADRVSAMQPWPTISSSGFGKTGARAAGPWQDRA